MNLNSVTLSCEIIRLCKVNVLWLFRNMKSSILKPEHFLFLCDYSICLNWSLAARSYNPNDAFMFSHCISDRLCVVVEMYSLDVITSMLWHLTVSSDTELWWFHGFLPLYIIFKGPLQSVYTSHGSLGYYNQTLSRLQRICFISLLWHAAIYLIAERCLQ